MNSKGRYRLPLQLGSLLSHRITGPLVTMVAILGRIIQLVFFYNIRVDASYQVMATRNLVNGHGISIGRVLANDLSQVVYQPLINWPPGYSLLLTPFYLLCGKNYVVAGLALDISAAILLIIISRKLLRTLMVPDHLINLFTIVTGFFVYYFYFIASSDAIAISIFLSAVYFYFRLRTGEGKWLLQALLLAVLLATCGAVKYLFLPVIFICPLLLILEGYFCKKNRLGKSGLLSFLILSSVMLVMACYQQSVAGSAGFISEPGRGFYPEHLLKSFPFLPSAFIKPDTIGLFLHSDASPGSNLYRIFQGLHIVLAIIFFSYAWSVFKKKTWCTFSPALRFGLLTLIVSLGLTLLLSFLSLRVAEEQILPGFFWTYVEDARYYGLAVVLVQMTIIIFFNRGMKKHLLFYVLLLLMFVETARGLVFDLKRLSSMGKEEYSWQNDLKFQHFADSVLKKAAYQYPGVQQVVSSSYAYLSNRVNIYSGIPVVNETEGLRILQHASTSRPVLLLLVLQPSDLPLLNSLIPGGQLQYAGKFNDLSLYTVYVTPGQ